MIGKSLEIIISSNIDFCMCELHKVKLNLENSLENL